MPAATSDEVEDLRRKADALNEVVANAQAARNTANDVTFECNFVGQGREPSGITLTFACSRTNLLTAKSGPGTTARSLQSGRFFGKKS